MNNKLILIAAALACLTTAHAQSTITGKEWDDPLKTSVNRETAHTIAIPVETDAEVTENDMTKSPYYQSLNGTWKFKWVGMPTSIKADWCAKDFTPDGTWVDIDVP